MNSQTLSLVKMAQEICTNATISLSPEQAVARLMAHARAYVFLDFLLEANQQQAIAELERRFSGYAVKPWEVQS